MWRIAARVVLVLAALTLLVLAASGAWLWFDYRPDHSQWVRDLHQVATAVLALLAVVALVIAIGRRMARRAPGVIASCGIAVTTAGAIVTGLLLPWDQLVLSAVTVGNDASGAQVVFDDKVKFVLIDAHEVSPSAYRFWAIAHVVIGVFVAAAVVLAWLRTREPAPVTDAELVSSS